MKNKINISLSKRINLCNPNDRSVSELDRNDNFNPLISYANKKQSKSQMNINQSHRHSQTKTHNDSRHYKKSSTIETHENDNTADGQFALQMSTIQSIQHENLPAKRNKSQVSHATYSACKYYDMYHTDNNNNNDFQRHLDKSFTGKRLSTCSEDKQQTATFKYAIECRHPAYSTQDERQGNQTSTQKASKIRKFAMNNKKKSEGRLRDMTNFYNTLMNHKRVRKSQPGINR